MENKYEGMRDPIEYDQRIMKSLLNWVKDHINERKPL